MLDKASLFLTGLVMTLGGLWYAADQFLDAPRAPTDRVVVADISEPREEIPFAETVKASVRSAAKQAAREAIDDAIAEVRPVLTAKAQEKQVAAAEAAGEIEIKAPAKKLVPAKPARPTSIEDILATLEE